MCKIISNKISIETDPIDLHAPLIFRMLAIIIAVIVLDGCGTIEKYKMDLSSTVDGEFGADRRVYAATKVDFYFMGMAIGETGTYADYIPFAGFFTGIAGLIDLPISIVTDTISLPYDLYMYFDSGSDINFWNEFSENKKEGLAIYEYESNYTEAGAFAIAKNIKAETSYDHLMFYTELAEKYKYDVERKFHNMVPPAGRDVKNGDKIISALMWRARNDIGFRKYLCNKVLSETINTEIYDDVLYKDSNSLNPCITNLFETEAYCKVFLKNKKLTAEKFLMCFYRYKALDRKSSEYYKVQELFINNPQTPGDIHEYIYNELVNFSPYIKGYPHDENSRRMIELAEVTRSKSVIAKMIKSDNLDIHRTLLNSNSVLSDDNKEIIYNNIYNGIIKGDDGIGHLMSWDLKQLLDIARKARNEELLNKLLGLNSLEINTALINNPSASANIKDKSCEHIYDMAMKAIKKNGQLKGGVKDTIILVAKTTRNRKTIDDILKFDSKLFNDALMSNTAVPAVVKDMIRKRIGAP